MTMPKKQRRRFNTLKMQATTAEDLQEVFEYFYDHFSDDDNFMRAGEGTEHELLDQFTAIVLKQLLGSSVIKLDNVRYIQFPKERFIHGGCQINGTGAVNLFYFEDIDVGLMAISLSPMSGRTEMVRFSCEFLGKDKKHSLN